MWRLRVDHCCCVQAKNLGEELICYFLVMVSKPYFAEIQVERQWHWAALQNTIVLGWLAIGDFHHISERILYTATAVSTTSPLSFHHSTQHAPPPSISTSQDTIYGRFSVSPLCSVLSQNVQTNFPPPLKNENTSEERVFLSSYKLKLLHHLTQHCTLPTVVSPRADLEDINS